jgi:hypothetical protein
LDFVLLGLRCLLCVRAALAERRGVLERVGALKGLARQPATTEDQNPAPVRTGRGMASPTQKRVTRQHVSPSYVRMT